MELIENYDPNKIYVCKNSDGLTWFVQGLEGALTLEDLLDGRGRTITVDQVGYLAAPFAEVVLYV